MSRRSAWTTMPADTRHDDTGVAPSVSARPWTGFDEPWPDREAQVFAPPYGQRPAPGPDPTDATDTTGTTDTTYLIAERIDTDGTRADGAAVTGRISPAAFMAGAAGLVLVAWAVVVLVRAGLGRPLATPIVEVGGFTSTAILGLIVLGAGALLLLAGATRSRVVIAIAGLIVTAAAVALALDPTFDANALAAERDLAIAVAILAGITTLVALLASDIVRVREHDQTGRDGWKAAS